MNKNLFRTQFDQLETTEKQALMERLAARYDMTFHGLHMPISISMVRRKKPSPTPSGGRSWIPRTRTPRR